MVEVVYDWRPLGAVLVSALAVVLIVASARRPNIRESWSVLAALGKFAIVASMLPGVLGWGGRTPVEYRWSMGEFVFGIDLALRADPLGMIFATLASFLWIFTAFYTAGYMRGLNEHGQTRFFAAFAASLSTAMGIAFAENLIVIFLFYELLSIVTYPLVAHDETDEARIAGRKYLAYTFFGGGFLVLGGTALTYWLTGLADPADVSGVEAGESTATVTFGEISEPLWAVLEAATVPELIFAVTFGMLAIGFGTKAAIMPVHSWLPDAMVAPTPVSGLLHAVAVVKSGAFGVARVLLDVFEPDLAMEIGMHVPLAALAAFSFLAASFIALRKDHLKQRLAYSTASQLSYIIMGVALLTPYGIVGGLLHIPAHAFMKLTLFFCAGAIHVETHTDYISNMAGIGKRMPLTMTAFAIAAAGMAGIPLVAGFVSKFYMLIGALSMEATIAGIVFASALIVSGVMNIAYFWPVVYAAFFEAEDRHDAKPLVEFPLGGKTESYGAVTDGGREDEPVEGADVDPAEKADANGAVAADQYPSDTDVPFGSAGATEAGEDDRVADAHDETEDTPHGDGHDEGDEHHDDHHHHGPPPGGWSRRTPRTESTWLMLMPIAVICIGAIALGVIPGSIAFLDLAIAVSEGVLDVDITEVFG